MNANAVYWQTANIGRWISQQLKMNFVWYQSSEVNIKLHARLVELEVTYVYINNAIAVCVIIAGVTQPIPVCVLLARVWHKHAVILETKTGKHEQHRFLTLAWAECERRWDMMKLVPGYSCCLCTAAYYQGMHQYLCPFHTHSHCQPSQLHTDTHTHKEGGTSDDTFSRLLHLGWWNNKHIHVYGSVAKSYRTGNAAVSFHDTFGIDVARWRLTVGAQSGTMAAAHLVTCETSFALSTAEGTLWTVQSHTPIKPIHWKRAPRSSGDLTAVL